MNWPFELPQVPVEMKTLADACVVAALRWAADEARREVLIELHIRCIPHSAETADTVRDRILAALPKEG